MKIHVCSIYPVFVINVESSILLGVTYTNRNFRISYNRSSRYLLFFNFVQFDAAKWWSETYIKKCYKVIYVNILLSFSLHHLVYRTYKPCISINTDSYKNNTRIYSITFYLIYIYWRQNITTKPWHAKINKRSTYFNQENKNSVKKKKYKKTHEITRDKLPAFVTVWGLILW